MAQRMKADRMLVMEALERGVPGPSLSRWVPDRGDDPGEGLKGNDLSKDGASDQGSDDGEGDGESSGQSGESSGKSGQSDGGGAQRGGGTGQAGGDTQRDDAAFAEEVAKAFKDQIELAKQFAEANRAAEPDEEDAFTDLDRLKPDQDNIVDAVSTAKTAAQTAAKDADNLDGRTEAETREAKTQQPGESPFREALKAHGLDRLLGVHSSNLKEWQKRIRELLTTATHLVPRDNPNLPNKRVKSGDLLPSGDLDPDTEVPLLGAEDDKRTVKNIVFILDCSGSMGAPMFAAALSEIQTFFKACGSEMRNRAKYHLVVFGAGSGNRRDDVSKEDLLRDYDLEYYKATGLNSFHSLLLEKGKMRNWSTWFAPAVVYAVKAVPQPDAVIILTDAEYFDAGDDSVPLVALAKAKLAALKTKLVWVLIGTKYKNYLPKIDPNWKKRSVVAPMGGTMRHP